MSRILIVDDNPEVTDILTLAVNVLGHESDIAFEGKQALESVTDNPPDLILLDISMPGMDGLETLRNLRASPAVKGTPVIVITGNSELDVVEQVMQAGGSDCLHKPVSLASLVKFINAQLQA